MDMNISLASEKEKKSHKKIFLWGILFGALLLWVGFLWWKQSETKNEIIQLTTSIENIKEQLYEKKGERTLKDMAESNRILMEAQKERILWSVIMQNILSYENNGIVFETFSISTEKNIHVSAKADRISQIKSLLLTLQKNEKILAPFVSSLSEQKNGDLDFQLSFQFIE